MSVSTLLGEGEGNTSGCVMQVPTRRSGVIDLMHVLMSLVRSSGDPAFGRATIRGETGSGEFKVSPDADGDGKSDRPILVKKQTNKGETKRMESEHRQAGGVCGAKGSDREKFESTGVVQ
jgi:hypothetical protein